jgi:site-specific recombinase XerD
MNQLASRSEDPTILLAAAYDWMLRHMDVSEGTIADYSGRLKPFIEYVAAHGLTEDSLLSYKRLLASDKSLSISTKNKKLTVARLLLRELHRRGHLARDITLGIKGFQQTKKHKLSGLDNGDIALLREWVSTNCDHSPKNLRLTCMLLLLAYHGLRQIELCRLDYEDIDFANSTVLIQGKGRDDKEVIHLNPEVTAMLRRYCKAYHIANGRLFFSISNNTSNGKSLTTRGLRASITRLFNQLGIHKNVHGLRHWYVSHLVQEFPGDLFLVMSFSRHRSLDQLQVYNDSITHAKAYPQHDKAFEQTLL